MNFNVSGKTIRGTLAHFRARLSEITSAPEPAGDELPLRSVLFSIEQMVMFASGRTGFDGMRTLTGRSGHRRCFTRVDRSEAL